MVSKTDYNSKVSFPINKGDILPDYAMNYYGINRVNKPDLSDSVMRVKFVDLFSGYLDSYVNQCDTVEKTNKDLNLSVPPINGLDYAAFKHDKKGAKGCVFCK